MMMEEQLVDMYEVCTEIIKLRKKNLKQLKE